MNGRIDWSKSPHDLGKAVIKYGEDIAFDALVAYLKDKGGEIVAQMKREAPWTDRTGQARRELRHAVDVNGTKITLYLITGAPYGMYLELRWGGRWAIVSPTIPRAGVDIGRELKSRMRR
jgi:hypothetical protein